MTTTTFTGTPPADVYASSTPLLSALAPNLALHLARLGPLPDAPADRLRAEVTESGLRGRGGAGFPTGRKLDSVAAAGRRAVIVGNGAEGEPASMKDQYLIRHAPHLVLDGLQVAARATGARRVHLYAPQALLDGCIGPALRQRSDALPTHLEPSPEAFLSGEASAVVSAVQGGPARPYHEVPRIFERGVGGRPTLVQNIETLAHLALIARFGADWFRRLGSSDEPGTRLVSLSGAVRRPGVYEVDSRFTLARVLAQGGGADDGVRALLIGGYHGGWVPYDESTPTVGFTAADLAGWDAAPGAGVVVALSPSACGLRAGADVAGYLAGQSARQCGPCRNGLPTMAATLRELAYRRPTPALWLEVERLMGLVAGRGACHHPAGTVRLVRSTLSTFADEVSLHHRGLCSARVDGRSRSHGGQYEAF